MVIKSLIVLLVLCFDSLFQCFFKDQDASSEGARGGIVDDFNRLLKPI